MHRALRLLLLGSFIVALLVSAGFGAAGVERRGFIIIHGVPQIKQEGNLCGAAVLAAVMTFWGYKTTQQAVAKEVFDETLQAASGGDLVRYARNNGLSAYSYAGSLDDLKAKGASVYAIAPAFAEFTSLASETGGRFYDIHQNPDFTSLINEIGQMLANQYRITYRSPRPTYDGTRRNVQVLVGGAQARKMYAEQHLLNVQSNCLVGLLCLLPLMFALVAPITVRIAWRLIQPAQATPLFSGENAAHSAVVATDISAAGFKSLEQSPAPEEDQVSCPHCGQAARRGARFCSRCGARL